MHEIMPPSVITIDGPTASGKGTLVAKLAETFDFYPLYVGMLYRMAGYFASKNRADFSEPALLKIAQQVIDFKEKDGIDLQHLKSEATASLAVRVAENANIMKFFDAHCRQLCLRPPNNKRGIIFDADHGGKVIAPNATLKIWLTAHLEIRAERRWNQLRGHELFSSQADVSRIICERDHARSNRPYAPMEKPEDAIEIDSTDLTIDAVYARAFKLITETLAHPPRHEAL